MINFILKLLVILPIIFVVILILLAFFFPNIPHPIGIKTLLAASKAEISVITKSLDRYKTDNNVFPSTEQGLKALLEKPTSLPIPKDWKGPYLSEYMNDPWGNSFQYRCPSQHNRPYFDLWSFGPDGKDGTEDDIANWMPTPK